jgi:FlaA1/EpsC-like NDP-sugar epimerase
MLLPRDGNRTLGRKGPMAKAFEGKVVLVTGANSGIGEAIAVAH